jgi:hypothetical protein
MSDITAMEEVFPELGDLTIGMFDMCAKNVERNIQGKSECTVTS